MGGPYDFSVTPVQTWSQKLGVRSLEFRVRSLELDWTSSGLSLDNFFDLELVPYILIMDRNLRFPEHGTKLVVATFIFLYGNFSVSYTIAIKMGIKAGFGTEKILLPGLGQFFNAFNMSFVHLMTVLFLTAWINNFTEKTKRFEGESFISKTHINVHLQMFESLQKGLGNFI